MVKQRFCYECGFSMSINVWTRHVRGKVHQKSVKAGTWRNAEKTATEVLHNDKDFVDVRVGWFEVAIKPTQKNRIIRTETALAVARDILGHTTIMTVEGGFRQYLKGEIVSIRARHLSYDEVVLKEVAL